MQKSALILFASVIVLSMNLLPSTRKASTQKCVELVRRLDARRGVRVLPSFELGLHATVADWRDTLHKFRKSFRVSNDLSIYGVSLRDLRRCVDVLVLRSMSCESSQQQHDQVDRATFQALPYED